ncbi:hypothetical protein [Longispora urticae]
MTATVTVCRGCCCGTARKVPGVDHDEQLDTLRDLTAGHARIRVVTDCLGPCERANVFVVQPARAGRAAGARPVWLGGITEPAHIRAIADWVNSGGPGLSEPDPVLKARRFPKPANAS